MHFICCVLIDFMLIGVLYYSFLCLPFYYVSSGMLCIVRNETYLRAEWFSPRVIRSLAQSIISRVVDQEGRVSLYNNRQLETARCGCKVENSRELEYS